MMLARFRVKLRSKTLKSTLDISYCSEMFYRKKKNHRVLKFTLFYSIDFTYLWRLDKKRHLGAIKS